MATTERDPMLSSRYFTSDPVTRDALWEALQADPTTGVAVVSNKGSTIYCNDAMARHFHGPQALGKHFTGVKWEDFYPEAWIKERLAVIKKVEESDRPVLLRSVWRGKQLLSYIRKIEGGANGRFLVITRAVAKQDGINFAANGSFEIVEANVVNLGELNVLSPRELEVLALLGQGLSLKEIAAHLGRSIKTVEKHRQSIGKKLHAEDRVKLAAIAHEAGLSVRDAQRQRVKPKR